MDLIFVFILGGLWGSFANVCIARLPNDIEVISGRSHCPKCKKKIIWYDNIPFLSFIFLKGKCRNCKKKISFQYLLVEIITAVFFGVIYFVNGITLTTLFLFLLTLAFVIIFFVDLKYYIIPDVITFPMMVIGFIKSFDPHLNEMFPGYLNSLLGGFFGYAIIWCIIFFYKQVKKKEGMGLGDAKLLAVIGFWFGLESVPFVIFLSSIIALIVVIPDLIKKSKKLSTQIPFGPYIIIGNLIYLVFKNKINFLIIL